jgi:hypothetical protein
MIKLCVALLPTSSRRPTTVTVASLGTKLDFAVESVSPDHPSEAVKHLEDYLKVGVGLLLGLVLNRQVAHRVIRRLWADRSDQSGTDHCTPPP